MTISRAITDFADALNAARAELGDVIAKIDASERERARIAQLPPHTDDIVAAFQRSLDNSASAFKRQLAAHLATNFANGAGERVGNRSYDQGADLLLLPSRQLTAEQLRKRQIYGGANGIDPASLNLTVLTYLLRDKIAGELPDLIARVFPQASKGKKASERAAALATIAAEADKLNTRRAELEAEIEFACGVAFVPAPASASEGNPQTPVDVMSLTTFLSSQAQRDREALKEQRDRQERADIERAHPLA